GYSLAFLIIWSLDAAATLYVIIDNVVYMKPSKGIGVHPAILASSPAFKEKYRQLLGALGFAVNVTWNDIAATLDQLVDFAGHSTMAHASALNCNTNTMACNIVDSTTTQR
ncbi:hypothetical protein SARC_13755, partial [Sphaeroforma arctica JP610]